MNIDLAFHNGRISTLNPSRPEESALGESSGNILAAGSDEEVLAQATAGTQHIDLNGRRVISGLNDSHLHVIRAGSLHWPTPTIEKPIDDENGPVMASLEYHIDPNREGEYRQRMHSLQANRLRDGGHRMATVWRSHGAGTLPGAVHGRLLVESPATARSRDRIRRSASRACAHLVDKRRCVLGYPFHSKNDPTVSRERWFGRVTHVCMVEEHLMVLAKNNSTKYGLDTHSS